MKRQVMRSMFLWIGIQPGVVRTDSEGRLITSFFAWPGRTGLAREAGGGKNEIAEGG